MSHKRATVILVHGAWHGSWCWRRLIPLIEQRGIEVLAPDLPSVGGTDAENLSSDAQAVCALAEPAEGPVLLCGHSYGGMVISLAASLSNTVTRLVYLCAFMPEDGQSLAEIGGGRLAPWIRQFDDGTALPDLERAGDLFYADCDPATRAWAVAQLRRQRVAAYAEPVPAPAWKQIDSTYIVCSEDRALPPDLQRGLFAPRAARTLELNSSHSPFLSQPAALAELLASIAT